MSREIRSAPNYTNAFLVMAFVNLLWIFIAIWAAWGVGIVLALAMTINAAINRLRPKRN